MPFLQPKSMPEKCFFHTLIRRKDSSNMPLEKKNTTKIVEAIRVISCIFPATLLKTLRTHVDPHVIDILDLPVIILNLLNLSTPSKNLTVVFPTLFFTKQVYHHLLLKTAFLTWRVEQLVIFVPLVSFPLYYAITAFFFSFFFFCLNIFIIAFTKST